MKVKTDNLFNYKAYKIKFKYEYCTDNKAFFFCNGG